MKRIAYFCALRDVYGFAGTGAINHDRLSEAGPEGASRGGGMRKIGAGGARQWRPCGMSPSSARWRRV